MTIQLDQVLATLFLTIGGYILAGLGGVFIGAGAGFAVSALAVGVKRR